MRYTEPNSIIPWEGLVRNTTETIKRIQIGFAQKQSRRFKPVHVKLVGAKATLTANIYNSHPIDRIQDPFEGKLNLMIQLF